ncbi:hypothetical protein MBRA_52570 (plasmid) [Mycobacterium branderi]|uniref:Transglycosylase n=1 Tax=Mycobacterium branderi TaxID=43348 RepID=A0ABM7KV06_9MYCO|nr:hypothetical protein MBRA_52570 [Mycobacterium branderi]
MGVVVARVGRVLGRAHALFGDPPSSGASAASGSGARLADAGDVVGSGRVRMAGSSGRLAGEYGVFAAGSGQALDRWAGADEGLGARLGEAAGADRGGRSASGAVVDAAAGDAAGLAPLANTPAGQRALLVALRARVAQQHKVVAAYRARDARLAALLRTMTYPAQVGAPTPPGGTARGFLPSSGGLAGLTHPGHPHTMLTAHHGRAPVSNVSAIDLRDVRFDKTAAQRGPRAAKGAIGAALDVRGVNEPAARRNWMRGYLTLMRRESGFDPNAVNTDDINNRGPVVADGARLGCSRGWTQMTPGAFAENHQSGTSTNIYDQVANIAASMNRMLTHYGVSPDASDLQAKVQQTDPGRPPHGY